MSDFFKNVKDTITETGKTVGEKTKQVGNTAKLNARIISSERSVGENYSILGKFYYENYKDDPDERVADAVNSVTASLDTIADLRRQLLAIKGLVKCVSCGADCPYDDTFCGKCGAKLEKPEPPVEEVVEEISDEELLGFEESVADEESKEDSDLF